MEKLIILLKDAIGIIEVCGYEGNFSKWKTGLPTDMRSWYKTIAAILVTCRTFRDLSHKS